MVQWEKHGCLPIKLYLQKWEQDNFHSTWNICLPINQELEPKWQVSKDGLVNPRETWKGVEKIIWGFVREADEREFSD